MPSSFTDPRLTAVYDSLNQGREDIDFYRVLAGDKPKTILDVGCGTGRLACEFASKGHRMTGADPACAMLDIARHRRGGNKVHWINSTAVQLSVDTHFDLIIMAGHVFQVFRDDEEVLVVLRNLRSHLAPGGCLAFETRNPAVREWETWTPDKTRETVDVRGVGKVAVHNDISAVNGQLITYETHFCFAEDDPVVASDTIRFLPVDELADFLTKAGFTDIQWYGNWDKSDLVPSSPEIIVVARG